MTTIEAIEAKVKAEKDILKILVDLQEKTGAKLFDAKLEKRLEPNTLTHSSGYLSGRDFSYPVLITDFKIDLRLV